MAAKPRLIALNIALLAGLGLIVWQGRLRWDEARAERRADVNVPLKKLTPPPMTPARKPDTVVAAKYAEVATKNLFSKDRNPVVIVDTPKVEPPKVMPPFPVVYGVLGLPSGVKAIMSERSGSVSKSVHTGDVVGDFKILALDTRKVTFEWDGRRIEKNIDELVDHSGAPPPGTSAGPAAPAQPAAKVPITSAVLGANTGTPDAPTRACQPGENSPAGTVVDGYRKTGAQSPFGLMGCVWVLNK